VSSLAPRPVSGLASSSRPVSELAASVRPVSGLAASSRPISGWSAASSRPASGLVPEVAVTPASDEASDAVDEPSPDFLTAVDDLAAPDQPSDTTVDRASSQAQDAPVSPVTDAVDNPAQVQDTSEDTTTGDTVPNQAEDNTITDRDLDVVDDSASYQILETASDRVSDTEEDPVLDQAPDLAANDPAPDTTQDAATSLSDAEQVSRALGPSQDTPAAPEPSAFEVASVASAPPPPPPPPPGGLEPTPVPEIDAATHIVVEHLSSGTVKTHVYSSRDGQPSLLGHVDPETIIEYVHAGWLIVVVCAVMPCVGGI